MTTTQKTRLLEAQDFTQQTPGTIVQDFEALLSLIGDRGILATPTHQFSIGSLETINQQLTHPLKLGLKRAIQKSYPHINGLYLLLRATGLGLIDDSGKKIWIKLDPPILESWRSLNGAERYFALLQAWWGRATEEIIGERTGWAQTIPLKIHQFIEHVAKSGIVKTKNPNDDFLFRYLPGLHNLALMELFGLLEIRLMPRAQVQGWAPQPIRMTDWGRALVGSYMDFIARSLMADAEQDSLTPTLDVLSDPLVGFEQWSESVRPSIKEWRNDLIIPPLPFQPGPHVFKAALDKDCWRRIAIRGNASLDELALVILTAFDFDNDHLYQFSYKDRFGRLIKIAEPRLESDGPTSDEVRVGDLPLFQGMRIKFHYDFGDDWRFTLETESVNADLAIRKPKVLARHGRAPEQYPNGDW